MASVMIRCPEANCDISTGIEMEPADFHGLPNMPGLLRDCPLCGANHIWFTDKAWLFGEEKLEEVRAVPRMLRGTK